jgi:PAS domain S-box-containing protein
LEPGAEHILGYQEAEILGQPGSIIFTPEDLQQGADQQELEKAVTEGRAEDERWHVRKDGTLFWASGITTPLPDETGQLRGFCKIMRDFTERKRAEDERNQLLAREQEARAAAEAANRLKDEFLATLSHELRSPLNAMLGWIRLLNSRKFDEATTTRALQTIERSAKSQAQLVEDLLDVSRIIQGKLRLNVRPVELVSVIEAAIETVRPAAQAKEISLQSVLDPSAGPVAGDFDRLQQVVWNLLSNAIKFTPKQGCTQVRLERVNSHVEIIITDTGKGIDSEFVPYVFERFRQADSSSTRVYSGLGLGLAIVRQLVELHGGTVRADSEGEGKGATFTVKLPLIPIRVERHPGERVHPTVDLGVPFDNPPALMGYESCLLMMRQIRGSFSSPHWRSVKQKSLALHPQARHWKLYHSSSQMSW